MFCQSGRTLWEWKRQWAPEMCLPHDVVVLGAQSTVRMRKRPKGRLHFLMYSCSLFLTQLLITFYSKKIKSCSELEINLHAARYQELKRQPQLGVINQSNHANFFWFICSANMLSKVVLFSYKKTWLKISFIFHQLVSFTSAKRFVYLRLPTFP